MGLLFSVLRASVPTKEHIFAVRCKHNLREDIPLEHDEIFKVTTDAIHFKQDAVEKYGLGTIDPALIELLGRNQIISQWLKLKSTMDSMLQ